MNEYGFGGFGYVTPPAKRKRLETDAELRARLIYVAADGNRLYERIQRATGPDLDAVADEFSLKRRTVEE